MKQRREGIAIREWIRDDVANADGGSTVYYHLVVRFSGQALDDYDECSGLPRYEETITEEEYLFSKLQGSISGAEFSAEDSHINLAEGAIITGITPTDTYPKYD